MTPDCKTRRPRGANHPDGSHLRTALELAAAGVPPLPLRQGKVPFGNCRRCADGACGGRPNMKRAGTCQCPAPCHAWAAATTDTRIINSPSWAPAWREAQAVAYHPGGAGVTVVDLDNEAAVAWARETLPGTRVVQTTRGEHWIYRGIMRSSNAVRPGVDVKSLMQYARWLGPGTGHMVDLPAAVRALVVKEETTPPAGRWCLLSPSALPGTGRLRPGAATPSATSAPALTAASPWYGPALNPAPLPRRSGSPGSSPHSTPGARDRADWTPSAKRSWPPPSWSVSPSPTPAARSPTALRRLWSARREQSIPNTNKRPSGRRAAPATVVRGRTEGCRPQGRPFCCWF